MSIPLESILENGGVVAATVSRLDGDLSAPLTVNLASNDATEATVPASVVIPANQQSAPFNLTIVNDTSLDGVVSVSITASAAGHANATDSISVLNDDVWTLPSQTLNDIVNLSPDTPSGRYEGTAGPVAVPTIGPTWSALFGDGNLYQTAGRNMSAQSNEFFPVDLAKSYGLAGWAKSGDEFGQRYHADNLQSFGFASYDADRLPILPQHVLRFAGAADTTLAAPLNPGDMTITLTSAAGWSNAAGAASGNRGLAWYGYQDGDGTTYANYTYTRNVALGDGGGLWSAGAIAGNVIALASPWVGPALAAGIAVRNTGAGDNESFATLDSQAVPGDFSWTQYASVIGGQVLQNGNDSAAAFRPGTAYIKPIVLANQHGRTGHFISWRDVTITEVPAGTTAADLALPVVDLTAVTGGDDRHAVAKLAGSTYAAGLVRVAVNQLYSLSTWGIISAEPNERLLGFASLDVDQKQIHPLHVTRYSYATETTLAAPLSPGDSSFLIANASGWSNDVAEPAHTRSIAWYGYADSTGHTYADYTYTRHVAADFDHGLWDAGDIEYDLAGGAYRVHLRAPWEGPAIAAGAAIRNAASGEAFSTPGSMNDYHGQPMWASHAATIGGGVWQQGQRSEQTFRPGTAYIQPIFRRGLNSGDITVGPAEDSVYGTPADPTKRVVEAGAQQVTLDLDVLAKNLFGAGASVVIHSVGPLAHGTVSIVSGAGPGGRPVVRYVSAASFVGTEILQYSLRNTVTGETVALSTTIHLLGGTLQTLGTLTSGVYDAPYATTAGTTVNADGAKHPALTSFTNGGVNASTVRLVAGPEHGTLRLNLDGTFQYTPAAGFTGVDLFRYAQKTSAGDAVRTAYITVHASEEALQFQRMRDVGFGMMNYESSFRRYPIDDTASYFNSSGLPLLSWRVHILRYIQGYEALYAQFRLNEPWNSPYNLPLAAKMPDIFRSVGDDASSTASRLQLVSGEGDEYYLRRQSGLLAGRPASHFTDGEANTFFAVEVGADKAITWTRPEAADFNPANPLASLGSIAADRFYALMADGKPIAIPSSIDAATFKALVTIAGNEVIDGNTLRRPFAEQLGGVAAADAYANSVDDTYFKVLSFAMLNYESATRSFPIVSSSSYFDANGNPYLSWRVHLLPYMGYGSLYRKFKLNEPWNSANNLPLLEEMPDLFRSVGDAADTTTTRIVTFTGPGAPFMRLAAGARQSGPSVSQFRDPSTILFLEAGVDVAIPWTKPQDIPLNVSNPLPALGDLATGEFRAGFVDGSVAKFSADISPASLAALATLNGGNSPVVYDTAELRDAATLADREQARAGIIDSPSLGNNFKQIALAMLNYESARARFPASQFSATGQPLLSWRVMILPYMGYNSLYSQFRLNEPWDSPHNLALLEYMPDVFRSPEDAWDSVTTRAMTFTGPGAPFTGTSGVGPTSNSISDGHGNTIMFVEAGANRAVPWTKPVDLPFNPNNPFSPLGELGLLIVTARFNGALVPELATISSSDLNALITHQGGSNPPSFQQRIHVSQSAGDTKLNEFGVDVFDVVLEQPPTQAIVLTLSTSNSAATLDKQTLTFTPQNWNVSQRVALRAVDDHADNVDRTVAVTVSSSIGLTPKVFTATVNDDDAPLPLAADFTGDFFVDGADFLAWQRGVGTNTGAAKAQGDADADGLVGPNDLAGWKLQFDTGLTGDFNRDGGVDGIDFGIWSAGFATSADSTEDGDANLDGFIDGADFLAWQRGVTTPMLLESAAISAAQAVADATPQQATAMPPSAFLAPPGAELQSKSSPAPRKQAVDARAQRLLAGVAEHILISRDRFSYEAREEIFAELGSVVSPLEDRWDEFFRSVGAPEDAPFKG